MPSLQSEHDTDPGRPAAVVPALLDGVPLWIHDCGEVRVAVERPAFFDVGADTPTDESR